MSTRVRRGIAAVMLLCGVLTTGCAPSATGGHATAGGDVAGRIAFVSNREGVNQIDVMDVNASGSGSNAARLTHDTGTEEYPSWSPDGKRLAYQHGFNSSAMYLINADGSGEVSTGAPCSDAGCALRWQPR